MHTASGVCERRKTCHPAETLSYPYKYKVFRPTKTHWLTTKGKAQKPTIEFLKQCELWSDTWARSDTRSTIRSASPSQIAAAGRPGSIKNSGILSHLNKDKIFLAYEIMSVIPSFNYGYNKKVLQNHAIE